MRLLSDALLLASSAVFCSIKLPTRIDQIAVVKEAQVHGDLQSFAADES